MHLVFVDVPGCDTRQLLPIAAFSQPAQKSAPFGRSTAHRLRCQTPNTMHPLLILLAHLAIEKLGTGPGPRWCSLPMNESQKQFRLQLCVSVATNRTALTDRMILVTVHAVVGTAARHAVSTVRCVWSRQIQLRPAVI